MVNPEFAWACGVFEGEGSLGVWRNGTGSRRRRRSSMQVVMSDREVLERLHAALGAGTIDGPYQQKSSNRPLYRWRHVGGTVAMSQLLRRMEPWLSERRNEQAQAIHDWASEMTTT